VKQVRDRLAQTDVAAADDADDDDSDDMAFWRFRRAGIPAPISDGASLLCSRYNQCLP